MNAQRNAVNELMTSLKQQRDELKLKMHLANAELRDEWDVLEDKFSQMNTNYKSTEHAVSETAADVWESFKLVGEEISAGFQRIRKSL